MLSRIVDWTGVDLVEIVRWERIEGGHELGRPWLAVNEARDTGTDSRFGSGEFFRSGRVEGFVHTPDSSECSA